MSYTDIDYADAFLLTQYQADEYWAPALDVLKTSCLSTASRQLAMYSEGLPADGVDAPTWLKDATCHQALYLLRLSHDTTYPRLYLTLGLTEDEDGNKFDHGYSAQVLCPAAIRILRNNGVTILPGAFGRPSTNVTQTIRP